MQPLGVKVLIPIQVLLALLAIPSGVLLVTSPSGEAIGAQTILPYLRQQLPFISDFTAVGVFLLVVYGLLPIVFSYGLTLGVHRNCLDRLRDCAILQPWIFLLLPNHSWDGRCHGCAFSLTFSSKVLFWLS